MKGKKLIGVEAVRINGQWSQVEVWANVLQLACTLAKKAARTKTGRSSLAFNAVTVKIVGDYIRS